MANPYTDNPTYSTNGRLISPGVVVPGTISMTNSELYFDADEDDPLYKQQDPKKKEIADSVNDNNTEEDI
ncbi:unnamed protein product [Dracunculus medinensis]|uniref:BEACH-type PH domain-containing protein n=1 Tax=Dracunculus medinensis TaxID=318479 RepID=A0A0N4U2C2_DRAME|nr:unnamed protein product [Dracunculus medinensis]